MEDLDKTIAELKIRLSEKGLKAVIIPHISPDGDAAGSCSALSEVLFRCGSTADIDLRFYAGVFAFS